MKVIIFILQVYTDMITKTKNRKGGISLLYNFQSIKLLLKILLFTLIFRNLLEQSNNKQSERFELLQMV